MPRFAILEHVGAPDDPAGWHLDLLLENGPACRTWRLMAMPEPGGPAMAAVELPAHRLAWLETIEADVSGGRGRVRRGRLAVCHRRALAGSRAIPGTCLRGRRGLHRPWKHRPL